MCQEDPPVSRRSECDIPDDCSCPRCGAPKPFLYKNNGSKGHFIIHKCVNPRCPYCLHNLRKVDPADLKEDYGKNKYKLHYIYRQFTVDFSAWT